MAYNSQSQKFDFEFDAPKFSEFLPNKDMSYYTPQECAINKNSLLDLWFLTYHADHYICTDKRKQKRKQSTDHQVSKTEAPHSSYDGDDQTKTRKRKQISSDIYQEKIKTENVEVAQKRISTNLVFKRQSSFNKDQQIQDQRRQSKLSIVQHKPQKLNSIADAVNKNPINQNIQDKRNSKLFSQPQDQNSTHIMQNMVKTENLIQKDVQNQNKQMIPEDNIEINTQQSTQNLMIQQNKPDTIANKIDETTQQRGLMSINNIFQKTSNNIFNQDILKDHQQQQQKSIFNLNEGILQRSINILSTIDAIQNMMQVKEKEKSTGSAQANIFQARSPQRRNSVDKQNIHNNFNNKIENNKNQQANNNKRRQTTQDKNIFNKKRESIGINQNTLENVKINLFETTKSLDENKNNSTQNKSNESDQNINQSLIRRNRQNKTKSIHSSSVESSIEQQQKQQRHKSLNISSTRKSIPTQMNNQKPAKRKSELSNILKSQTIVEEQNSQDNIQQFEKNWEKQNGIKLYMLDYQKRKEIRSLFFEKVV